MLVVQSDGTMMVKRNGPYLNGPEMCGESGEAANIAKKIRRLNQNLPNREAGIAQGNLDLLRSKLATEVADSIIYGLIILSEINVDASQIISEVFDKKSIEYGFPERANNQ
jgi:phosphoribosyl-ATP pyrophosphohydrolase